MVAGCGFDVGASSGAPADGRIDVPVDLLDDLDDDDDGVLDVVDNCPLIANADQHDEDGDLRGDRCDPCPQVANQDADSDGDGVGDACDPHPGVAGDVLVLFEGFGVPSTQLPAGWSQIGGFPGDWDISQDTLQLDTNDTAHLLRYDAGAAHTTLDLALDTNLPGVNVPSFSAIVDGDAGLTTFQACSVLYNEQSRRLQTFAGGVFTSLQIQTGTVTVPGPHRAIATTDGQDFTCTFPPVTPALQMALTSGGRTSVGLRVRNLRVAIHYVAIYRAP